MLSRFDQMLQGIEDENRRIDEKKFEIAAARFNKDVKKYCGDMADIVVNYNAHHKKKFEQTLAEKSFAKGHVNRAKVKMEYDNQPISEDEMKRRLKMFAKKHVIKVINASQYNKQQEEKMHERVANTVSEVKRNLIEKAKNKGKEVVVKNKPAIKGITSKKTIEKAKTVYLDTFTKDIGAKPKAKEVTKLRVPGLHHAKPTGRDGRA